MAMHIFPEVHECSVWIDKFGNCPLGQTHRIRKGKGGSISPGHQPDIRNQLLSEKPVESVVDGFAYEAQVLAELEARERLRSQLQPALVPGSEESVWDELVTGGILYAAAGAATAGIAMAAAERAYTRYRARPARGSARALGRGGLRFNFAAELRGLLGQGTSRRLRRREEEPGGTEWVDPLFGEDSDVGGEEANYGEWYYLAQIGTGADWILGDPTVDPNNQTWADRYGAHWVFYEGEERETGLPGPPADASALPGDWNEDDSVFESDVTF